MNVYRSLNHIYVQVIDDRAGNEKGGVTIAAASTMDKAVKEKVAGLNKTDAAKVVGSIAAERAMAKGVQAVVFDRGGYLYTGRVKAVADGAREAGLKF
jgi:large subunit ribosomal protein L18